MKRIFKYSLLATVILIGYATYSVLTALDDLDFGGDFE